MTTLRIGYDTTGHSREVPYISPPAMFYGVLFSLPIWWLLWLAARWIWRIL